MDPIAPLDRAVPEFARRLRAVRADQWDAPTPCERWSVRDLVNHVVAGNRMTVVLLAGADREEATATVRGEWLGDDPYAAFEASAAEQAAAFRAPGALERTVAHPAGDIDAARMLGFRVADLVLHAWDLARGTGGDEELDPELVRAVYEGLAPMAPFIGQVGMFGTGPSGTATDETPLQARLLDLSGRRP